MNNELTLDRNLALEAVRVTEAAAMACRDWVGKGNEKAADAAAVEAMRRALNILSIQGTVVIGEGERDKAPMLYIGEKVGAGDGPEVDIALDPLEGTTICATSGPNSLAVMAMAEKGGFLHAPDVYMSKIAVGGGLPDGVVDLDASPAENIRNLAKAKGKDASDIIAIILDRTRHEELIAKTREAGAKVKLIGDGDVAGVIETSRGETADIYMGIGGAPEGVLAAAALRSIGGQMQGRLLFDTNEKVEEGQKARAKRMGIADLNKKYSLHELAKGDVMFSATGVTDGSMLQGVRKYKNHFTTESIIMRSKTGTVRIVKTEHYF
jgi:fructose-1,6-bisphosphatase II / sedoheptulose-1,7-bisphosphatase